MSTAELINIDLSKLASKLSRYENLWIAITADNTIVASGKTYGETLDQVDEPERVVLFKVPPLDAALAPMA